MKRCLIIFAREPQKGRVKTRLKDCLSTRQCLNLYKAFLKDTIDIAKNIKCEDRILAYESIGKPQYLKKIARPFRLYKQKGRNLGDKMHNAFKFAVNNKATKVVIIGSDSPTLPPGYIEEAFRRLDRNDVVVGPSYDYGYYLIGLKKACFGIFKSIQWSSDRVFAQTAKNARRLNKKIAILDKWYDIDKAETLTYLKQDLKKQKDKSVARWTRKFLKI